MGNCTDRRSDDNTSSEGSADQANFLERPEPPDLSSASTSSPETLKNLIARTDLAYDAYQRRLEQVADNHYNTYSFKIQRLTPLDDSCCCFMGDVFVKVCLLPGGPDFETSTVVPFYPVWNRSFQFVTASVFEVIQIEVYMKGHWGTDRLIGSLVLTEDKLVDQHVHQGYFPVGTYRGIKLELAVRIQALTNEAALLNQYIEQVQNWQQVLRAKLESHNLET